MQYIAKKVSPIGINVNQLVKTTQLQNKDAVVTPPEDVYQLFVVSTTVDPFDGTVINTHRLVAQNVKVSELQAQLDAINAVE
jgi:hypothetical protein